MATKLTELFKKAGIERSFLKVLTDAYDCCILVRDFTGNVIADPDDEIAGESDHENYKKADNFITFYENLVSKNG